MTRAPSSFGNLVLALLNAGKLDSAVALQRLATTRFPGNLRLVVTGAYITYAQHDYAETEKIARSLLNQGVPPDVHVNALGGARAIAAMQGRLHRAMEDSRSLAELGTSLGIAEVYYDAFSQMAVLEAVYRNDPCWREAHCRFSARGTPAGTGPGGAAPVSHPGMDLCHARRRASSQGADG